MRKIWRRKWLVVAGAVAIFLSVGAIAWAAAGDGTTPEATTAVAAVDDATGAASVATANDPASTVTAAGAAVKNAVRQGKQRLLKLQKALMDQLRKDMTPQDQALYDQLVAKAKDQRQALQNARHDLAGTLKQLRELRNKYLKATTTTTG